MEQWEFNYVQVSTNDMASAMREANRLGALGWEPVGIASADRTIGLNSNVLIFKRPVRPLPPPADQRQDAFLEDPSGRYDRRRWNGRAWTAEVGMLADRQVKIDPPTSVVDRPWETPT